MSAFRADRAGLVVLTGGAATRMGRDKAALDTGGVALAERPILALGPLCSEVVLAGRAVAGVEARVVLDAAPGLGPLAGVVAGLLAVGAPTAVVVACDMPAVVPGLVGLLLACLRDPAVDACVCARAAGAAGGIEPLPLAVRTAAAARLEGVLSGGGRSLRDGLAALRVAILPEAAWRAADPAGASFENWNRPADVRPLPPAGPGASAGRTRARDDPDH